MKRFTDQPLLQVTRYLKERADRSANGDVFAIEACRPELKGNRNEGSLVALGGLLVRARSIRAWADLAETIGCRLLTPLPTDDSWMKLSFQKIESQSSWHDAPTVSVTEKYGVDSLFADIDKREDPSFLDGFSKSLTLVGLKANDSVLNLGINTGDEFALLRDLLPQALFDSLQLVGVDHCESAVAYARRRFSEENVQFVCGDINRLEALSLDVRFALIISIGTLQSPGIESKRVFMSLIQDRLAARGSVIFGFPNCRYVDGEIVYGAKIKNYCEPDLSLLIKDIHFAKKYLQQHRFTVRIFGKDYLFMAGVRYCRQNC